MNTAKPVAKRGVAVTEGDEVTVRTFVRAAGAANLLVAALLFVEFSVLAVVNRDSGAFLLIFWLVPFVTAVVWGAGAVLCCMFLAPSRLVSLWRTLRASDRSASPMTSGI
jgi:hypothetical protein